MTNEKKERLKEIIDSLLNSNMGTTGELNYQEMMWFQETIHSLLDRVPSEEEAKDTWDRLKNITLKNGCDYPEYCDADNCLDFVECSVILEKIRKALGLEGKE